MPSILEEPDSLDPNLEMFPHTKETSNDSAEHNSLANQNLFQNGTMLLNISAKNPSPEHNLMAKSNSRYRSIKRLLSEIRFNCTNRNEGYYSDSDFDCKVFHYCKKNGVKFTFICPGNAVFSQEELTCDSTVRDAESACRSSEDFYFLNTVLYHPKGQESIAELTATVPSSLKTFKDSEKNEGDSDFEKWVTYIATGSVASASRAVNSDNPMPSKVHFQMPIEAQPAMQQVKFITNFPRSYTTQNPVANIDSRPSELSIMHSPTVPDFLLTSPSPPIEQIDTPRWYLSKNVSNDFVEQISSESINKYSQASANSYVATDTETSLWGDETIGNPKEVTEVANSIDKGISSPTKVYKTTRPPLKAHLSENQPAKHKISHPFQVDWDDDDRMLVEEFHSKHNKVPQILRAPVNEEGLNYLYGKPSEPLPSEHIHFSPVEFESVLSKIPQDLHTLPIISAAPTLNMDHQQQMMAQFGHFDSLTPSMSSESLQLVNSMASSTDTASSTRYRPKSQMKVLFGNLVGGGHKMGRRRWLNRKGQLPFIWPLAMDNFRRRQENVAHLMRPQRSYANLPWRVEQTLSPNSMPLQFIQIDRRSDKDGHSRATSKKFPFFKFLFQTMAHGTNK